WTDIGQWVAGNASDRASASATTATPLAPTATPTATVGATPAATAGTPSPAQINAGAAPLGFTEWGVFIAAGSDTLKLPTFMDFTVTTAAANP
ncbi:MAG TPA: hypothetical protein VKT52_01865, partial [Ktedonobacterales bacterium]|nr:hypothetical protein [Ktedonobacterales bacterium]